MQLGTQEEIDNQYVVLNQAEDALVMATLRLRALKGEGLMQSGDSFPVRSITAATDALIKEFGSRNLRTF